MVDSYAKTFPILYPCLENSTTGNAILIVYHGTTHSLDNINIISNSKIKDIMHGLEFNKFLEYLKSMTKGGGGIEKNF